MKKSIFTLSLLTGSLFISANLFGQSCGTDGPSVCTPGGVPGGGFQNQDSLPCAERQVAYDETFQFTMFSQFNFQGQQDVDSLKFTGIGNLPCGLCWSANQADKTYSAGENGCIRITGITNDVAGQYKLNLSFTAWINGLATGIPVSSSLASQAGISLYFRVKDNGSNTCSNVDTASNANNLTATTGCPLGIEDVNIGLSSFSIVPNPMNSESRLSFISEKSGTYQAVITDFSGAIVRAFEINANQGLNETVIRRDNLNTGVYFISISNGNAAVNRRFTVIN